MKDTTRSHPSRHPSKGTTPPPGRPHGARVVKITVPRDDPASLVGVGFPGGMEKRFREIHTSASHRTCFACREDLGAPELNYRIVLRCTGSIEEP